MMPYIPQAVHMNYFDASALVNSVKQKSFSELLNEMNSDRPRDRFSSTRRLTVVSMQRRTQVPGKPPLS
jgi:hypothetical protein